MDSTLLISVPIELEDNVSSTTSDPIEVKKVKDDYKFKKRLIAQVRKHGILYDNKNKKFTNVAEKEKTWLKIATTLTAEVSICKHTWIDLRYDYQRYARRLRKFFNRENKNNKRRPIMAMETDMIFLWRFVANKSLYPLPTDENNENTENTTTVTLCATEHSATEDEVIDLLEDDPPVIIDLDSDDDNNTEKNNQLSAHSKHLITREVRRLVDLVKVYPELYNSKHRYYNDFKRKGIIWNAIASELGDKGTKLMKSWLYMQTRYEWELNHLQNSSNDTETELQKLLQFLSSHMDCNPNTVYKHAFYLKKNWQEPIEHFKTIFSLLKVMKKIPQIVTLTDQLLHVEMKNDQYFQLWHDVAKMKGTSMGVCETTWLILRSFYWELVSMHKCSYQLQDKWYFESIITELYALAEAAKTKSSPVGVKITVTPMVDNLDENKISSKIEKKKHQLLNSTTSTNPNVVVNKQVKIPKIISAKSLAPPQINVIKTYPGTGLQITPMTSPTAAAAAYNAGEPQSLSLNSTPSSSSIALNNNIVPIKLPYQLPHNTKVTALPPSATATVSTATTSMTNNPSIKHAIASMSLNAATTNANIVTATQTPVTAPKITGSVQKLNPNEIMIELISSLNGNQLVVHGPPLTGKYTISMVTTAKFIREVMAVPVLHNKIINQQPQANFYWHYISKGFNLPVDICKAIWRFLLGNFNHFPQIAPMEDLMKPFKISINVWQESHQLFDSFHEMAVSRRFLIYKQPLPELMKHIGLFFTSTKKHDSHIHWPTMFLIFPRIYQYKMKEMWIAFKKVFVQYMRELERGIDNKWPQEWWHVLEKMQFLTEIRYHSQEPFYYIVRNKITEEIERCKLYEISMNANIEKAKKQCLLEAQQPQTSNTVALSPPIVNSSEVSHTSPNVPSSTPPPLIPIRRELPSLSQAQINTTKVHNRADIDAYTLILAIRRHPKIYQRSRSADKVKAWKDVAMELKTSLSSCRLALQRAVKNYRTYEARDPTNNCHFNHRYFKHLSEIYRVVKSATPTEPNQSADSELTELNETNFPERFIFDINMDTAKPALVMKNWAFAIGSISQNTDPVFEDKLRQLFSKFLCHANV